jgi:uncharacterized metal-binding protein
MTEPPTCSCGSNELKRVILPCAGQANTGQLTNLVAIQLTEEGFGNIACIALLAIGAEGLITNARDADEVVVLDGCPMLCAKKIVDAQGVPIAQHLIMTELGITKGPSKSYTDDDVENIVSACWAGTGMINDPANPSKKNAGPDNDCGCGCDGPC